jgi:hypothetical protein
MNLVAYYFSSWYTGGVVTGHEIHRWACICASLYGHGWRCRPIGCSCVGLNPLCSCMFKVAQVGVHMQLQLYLVLFPMQLSVGNLICLLVSSKRVSRDVTMHTST